MTREYITRAMTRYMLVLPVLHHTRDTMTREPKRERHYEKAMTRET